MESVPRVPDLNDPYERREILLDRLAYMRDARHDAKTVPDWVACMESLDDMLEQLFEAQVLLKNIN